mmetsp:Transcript_14036/g.39316  ORF Transcript_14036/g.39316 Transcript_14036/m.39316 type:complete len:282 (-) Transcript_14036:890-1735(-)|eukprot:CAMPEP_0172358918 /NCGR_PEP_ID=MMETSP1060-20121228/3201_1 /TAXON_ID=37318 /ORGANISM="Pseudo-nitzschia pungens, Strain cf. cingulata" /LENGTH=281 /DNA_ID=CAMNT_0013080357 /DNA_START=171 /DNA_END=1016 /DNA_ORIENTATION=+
MPFANPGQNNNLGRVGDNPGPADMFNALPIITRAWFGATIMVTLSVNFKIISGYQMIWSWENVTSSLEVWRFLTPFCYAGRFSFDTLIACYMLVQFSKQYESGGPFNTGAGGGTADFAFCILLGALCMLATYPLILGFGFELPPVFAKNLIYYVLYVWSKRHPTNQANIWGFPIQAMYLPFAYLALTVFMGNPYMDMLHGLVIGHLYYFAVDVIPVVYGKDFLHTPNFLIDYFGVGEYQAPPPAAAPPANQGGFGGNNQRRAPPSSGGHDWGSGGNRLGTT